MTETVAHPNFAWITEAERQEYEPDRRLPTWARRSHPLVRRHLGLKTKIATPDLEFLVKLFAWEIVAVLTSFPVPFLLELLMLAIIASAAYLPIVALVYFRSLFFIITSSVNAIAEERKDDALSVLRTIPLSFRQIMLAKIAAGVWKQAETLELILLAVVLLSLPATLIHYAIIWPAGQSIELLRVLSLCGVVVAIARTMLEPVMAGALGILVGSMTPLRISATSMAAILLAAYYVLTNLIRLLPLSWGMWLVVELVLPVVLPLLITWGALRVSEYLLCKD